MPIIQETCDNCGKDNHFRCICRSGPRVGILQVQKGRPTHEIQQTGDESWQDSVEESDRQINTVGIACLTFHSIRSSVITNLETRSRQKKRKKDRV